MNDTTKPRCKTDFRLPTYQDRGQGTEPCVRCGAPITHRTAQRWVHMVEGGGALLHPDDEALYQSGDGDMYWFPIGADCARSIGLEWSIVLEKEPHERHDETPL